MAEAQTRTEGRRGSRSNASQSRRVPAQRLSHIVDLAVRVQRCPTLSPARCTTASGAQAASKVTRRVEMFQVACPGAGAASERLRGRASCPAACKAGSSAEPIRPDAPLTRICLGSELATVDRVAAEGLFDAEELIVLGVAIAAAEGAGL